MVLLEYWTLGAKRDKGKGRIFVGIGAWADDDMTFYLMDGLKEGVEGEVQGRMQ